MSIQNEQYQTEVQERYRQEASTIQKKVIEEIEKVHGLTVDSISISGELPGFVFCLVASTEEEIDPATINFYPIFPIYDGFTDESGTTIILHTYNDSPELAATTFSALSGNL